MPKGASYLLITVLIGCAIFVGAISMPWERFSPSAYGPDINPPYRKNDYSIERAEYGDGRLWLLSETGKLWSVAEEAAEPIRAELASPVHSLCVREQGPAIVIDRRGQPDTWAVQELKGDRWVLVGTVPKSGEGLVSLTCDRAGLSVLTSQRLISFNGGRTTITPLTLRVPALPRSVVLTTPGRIFVGLNVGEWGGGLMSIDRHSGEVIDVAKNTSGELCAGPLNPDCDPVKGLSRIPWRPDCVAAAIGLMHMSAHGRLVEVCGREVKRLYFGPCPTGEEPYVRGDGEPFCTEALHGVSQNGNALVAVGTNGLSIVGEKGLIRREPLPASKAYGPFEISFGADIIFIWKDASRRDPMIDQAFLVPRQRP